MRLSVDKNDPGYVPRYLGARVYLDGIERSRVITADEEQRLIVRCVTDERGRPVLNRERNEVARETLHGEVRIELSDKARALVECVRAAGRLKEVRDGH